MGKLNDPKKRIIDSMNGSTAIFISVKRLHFLASNFSLDNYQKTFVVIFSITLFLILPNYSLFTWYKVFQEDCNVIHRVIFLLINRLLPFDTECNSNRFHSLLLRWKLLAVLTLSIIVKAKSIRYPLIKFDSTQRSTWA